MSCKKSLWLTVGLSLLFVTCACAKDYRCRTPDGELFMTDREDKLPADCQPLNEPKDTGGFNIVPAVPVNEVESSPAFPEKAATSSGQEVDSWEGDANTLVESYKDAVHRRYHEDLEINRLRATQDIEQLKKQKHDMLNALSRSDLKDREKNEIREILDRIPEK